VPMEADVAIYTCSNANWTIDGVSSQFSIACGPDGTFGTVSWPTCANYNPASTVQNPCQCLGDLPNTVATPLRDNVCRNLTSSIFVQGAAETPPSRIRCGTTDVNDLNQENACFCDSPQQESRENFRCSFP
jgi:hypothetical protein